MQIKSVGSALAIVLLSSAAAFAADLPSRRAPPVYAPPPPIPVFTWTGIYIGGQIGYEFGKDTAFVASSVTPATAFSSVNPTGIIGGAHIGYNFSTQGLPVFGGFLGAGGVFGVEGDVDGSGYRRLYSIGALSVSDRQTVQGSVRGRLGIAVDRVLFYATGGAAFGGLRDSYAVAGVAPFDVITKTRVGYTVGGGIEYALTNNWSVRGEYRYTDFGSYTDTLGASTGGLVSVRHTATDNRVQAGVSYKFDAFSPLAPVVARY